MRQIASQFPSTTQSDRLRGGIMPPQSRYTGYTGALARSEKINNATRFTTYDIMNIIPKNE